MSAVHSDLLFVQNGNGGQGCGCGCNGGGQTIVFRSVWDRLVHQLFGSIPIGMVAEGQLPDIHIYTNVVLLNDTEPYSFAVVTDDGSVPQPHDVIQYKDKFYVIGAVAQENGSPAAPSDQHGGDVAPIDDTSGQQATDGTGQVPDSGQTGQVTQP